MIANTPDPPYYAVIFSSIRTDGENGYSEAARRMAELAATQPGFLGLESARNEIEITVSYWDNLQSIRNWKNNAEHLLVQRKGKDIFYKSYKIRICKVERNYGFDK